MSLETQYSQVTTLDKSPFNFEDNITKFLFFLVIYAQAVFQKGHLETPKGRLETKWYYVSDEV